METDKNNTKVSQPNARSIWLTIDEVIVYTNVDNRRIIVTSDSWMDMIKKEMAEVEILGYNIWNKDRPKDSLLRKKKNGL